MDYPELKRAVRAQAEAYKATVVLIEDRASGVQLIQEGIAEGVHAIKRYVPEGDKQMRLYAQTGTIENGFVYVPREAPWLNVLNYNFRELALERYHSGHTAAAIAEEFRLPLEQVHKWIDEEKSRRSMGSPCWKC